MSEKREKREWSDPFYDRENVVSAMECTGLMPALPQDEDEDETEARLYAIHDEET